MAIIRAGGCERAHGESRDLLYRRREATPQFKDCAITQNLILSLGYYDFKSN